MNSFKELFLTAAVAGSLCITAATAAQGMKRINVRCSDNLKNLRRAAQMYENDHNGIIPPVLLPVNGRAVFWTERIIPYLGSRMELFYCPQDEKRGAKMLDVPDLLPIAYSTNSVSYGMNYYIGDVGRSRKNQKTADYHVSKIKAPSYLIYFGDSASLRLRPTSYCWHLDYAPRHDNKSLFVFADGHVEKMDHNTLGLLGEYPRDKRWKTDRKRWLLLSR